MLCENPPIIKPLGSICEGLWELAGKNCKYLSREGFKPDRDSNQFCLELSPWAYTIIQKIFVVNGAEEKVKFVIAKPIEKAVKKITRGMLRNSPYLNQLVLIMFVTTSVAMTTALLGAPALSKTPSHPFELTVSSEVVSLDQLIQPFRFALWVEGHNQETEFLSYHFNAARNKATFLDFLERVFKELSRYKDSEREVIRTIDFDTCSNKEKYNKNYSRDLMPTKCSLLRSFIDRKREQVESHQSKIKSDPSQISQLLYTILDGCHQSIFRDPYSSEQLKKILFDPLNSLTTKVPQRLRLNTGKKDVVFTLFAIANSIWHKLGRETLRTFVFANFHPDTKSKLSASYFDKFQTPKSKKRSDQIEKMRGDLMDAADVTKKAEVTKSYEQLFELSEFSPK